MVPTLIFRKLAPLGEMPIEYNSLIYKLKERRELGKQTYWEDNTKIDVKEM
jgi:hypothetical protein